MKCLWASSRCDGLRCAGLQDPGWRPPRGGLKHTHQSCKAPTPLTQRPRAVSAGECGASQAGRPCFVSPTWGGAQPCREAPQRRRGAWEGKAGPSRKARANTHRAHAQPPRRPHSRPPDGAAPGATVLASLKPRKLPRPINEGAVSTHRPAKDSDFQTHMVPDARI